MSTQTAPILAGKYHLLRKLGAGGMAEVYLAKQSGLEGFEKLVVIKRILPHLAQDQEFVTMFLDEARAAADLRHPNVVNVFEVNAAQGTYYMAMEFLHGQDIRKMQRKSAAKKTSVPMQHACQVIIDAATGLHYAHTKQDLSGRKLEMVHRDVSPQNILVTYDGTTKIVDFGIAKAASQETHTATGVIKGKYTYMSPEQAQGEDIDHRSDQFALGVIFWELLTMRRLFKRPTEIATMNAIIDCEVPRPSLFTPDIPEHLEHVVLQCLQKDPDNRFDSCEDVALELEDFLAESSVVHSPARVGHYMRELFAEEIASEADLGTGQLDGESFSSLPGAPPESSRPTSGTKVERSRSRSHGAVDVPDAERGEPDARTAFSRSQRSQAEPQAAAEPALLHDEDVEDDDRDDIEDDERTRSDRHGGGAFHRSQIPDLEDFSELDDMTATSTPETVIERYDGVFAPLAPEPAESGRVALVAGVAVAVVLLGALLFLAALQWSGVTDAGELTVRTTPAGARIVLDGKDTGRATPHVFKDLGTTGAHEVRLELAGYLPETASFRFGERPRVELDVPLTRLESTVTSRPTGVVQPIEDPSAPASGEPQAAEPTLVVEDPAPAPRDAANASRRERDRREQTKPQKPARLRIVVEPWAEVFIDGRSIGETPLKPRRLPPGTYKIELKNSELKKSETRTLRLGPGDDELIRVKW